jgi:hypothetical protein
LNDLNPRRLRLGEIVAGASATLLLIFLFVPDWYTVNGALRETLSNLGGRTSWNGWWGLSGLRYLVLLTIIATFALTYLQAARREPAAPVVLSVIVTVLGGATVIALLYRVASGPPSYGSLLNQQAGPYLGLVAAIGIAYGGYKSMRQEHGTDPAALDIKTVQLHNGT